MKGLLGVFRANRTFFDTLDRFYRDGGNGHFEWVWTYVAREAGLTFEDFGGDGPFVRPGNRNRFYFRPRYGNLAPGTFRFRPFMSKPGRRPNTLYHPVKDRPIPLGERLQQRLRFLRRGLGSVRHGETNYGQPADVTPLIRFGQGQRETGQ